MEDYKEKDRENTFSATGSHLTVNDEQLKDPTGVANAFYNFFITITEKLNDPQIQKGDVNSISKDSFPGNFPNTKIIPITQDEIKLKKSSGYDEITSKILKLMYISLITH